MLTLTLVTLGLLIISALFALATCWLFANGNDIFGSIVAFLAAFALSFAIALPIASVDFARKAHYYNTRLGTHYTTTDMVLYGNEIEAVEIPKKVRLEQAPDSTSN